MFKKLTTFILFVCFSIMLAQFEVIKLPNAYSEGNFYHKNGKVYSDAFVVKFKENVIQSLKGKRNVSLHEIKPKYIELKAKLNDLNSKYGLLKIYKQVPKAEWGNITKYNKRTGEYVEVHDYSQLITIKCDLPFPIDSVIKSFALLPEVDYVLYVFKVNWTSFMIS